MTNDKAQMSNQAQNHGANTDDEAQNPGGSENKSDVWAFGF
jgi:hypothetical protein